VTWVAPTLWDLFRPRDRARAARSSARKRRIDDRYDALVEEMKRRYDVRVRRWRSSMSGVAWERTGGGRSVMRLIEAPRPRGPVSCAIFLHEVGHHAIGFATYRPRCLEEYHAWRFALDTMREWHLNVTPRVEQRVAESLRYAVDKARRRGLKRLPPELRPYA
jgi:hypothetical protein